MIDAAQLHLRDAFGGDFDRVDAFFRTDAGMGFEAVDVKLHAVGRRRFGKEKAHGVAIEHETRARAQTAHVETFGADQTGFFADRKDHVDGAARNAGFP